MKLIILFLFCLNAAWSLDYDPKFHLKHRYNGHAEIKKVPGALPKSQKMEASETSPRPLETTPNNRTTK